MQGLQNKKTGVTSWNYFTSYSMNLRKTSLFCLHQVFTMSKRGYKARVNSAKEKTLIQKVHSCIFFCLVKKIFFLDIF